MNRKKAELKAKEYMKDKPFRNDKLIFEQTVQYYMDNDD